MHRARNQPGGRLRSRCDAFMVGWRAHREATSGARQDARISCFRQSLAGTWKLRSVVTHNTTTGADTAIPSSVGYLTFVARALLIVDNQRAIQPANDEVELRGQGLDRAF